MWWFATPRTVAVPPFALGRMSLKKLMLRRLRARSVDAAGVERALELLITQNLQDLT